MLFPLLGILVVKEGACGLQIYCDDVVFVISHSGSGYRTFTLQSIKYCTFCYSYTEADAKDVHTCLRTAAGVFEYALVRFCLTNQVLIYNN